MNTRLNSKRGFTLIEVILVLAIAALIFLMVFIALPALQASQRDTARKNDASIVSAAITRYVSGEREAITASTDPDEIASYIDDLDQYDETSAVVLGVAGTDTPEADEIMVYPAAKCNGSAAEDASNRQSAVVILLDDGENTYCVDAS